MKSLRLIIFLFTPWVLFGQTFSETEISKWQKQARKVTIVRDNYGVPHIYGDTDADAVFGLLYAQCEDDFARVEMNYIDKLGRLAEVYGEGKLYDDLLTKLVIDEDAAKKDFASAPKWLKKLCVAFADGINYYLYSHPEVKPQLLERFEPWYPLLWTDGSIGAISTGGLGKNDLRNFYEKGGVELGQRETFKEEVVTGSNGFAFSPKITASGNAILYINPHVTFYFRPEVHVVSKEGLNAYGAVTWGQFFVYQGFNENLGWMHTSSYTDVSDVYREKITRDKGRYFYEYNGKQLPVKEKKVTLSFIKGENTGSRIFTTYFTGHGPILGKEEEAWLSVKSDNRNIKGLIQSWQRTKATNFKQYKKSMDLLANASNNTVYADKQGNIAYWHGNFIPRRNTQYDWSKPVDGTISATEWKGLHPVSESIHIYNPLNGWVQNCNSTPFTAAGNESPRAQDYPAYMSPDGENFRGLNAVRVLEREKKYTLDKVIAAGYDTYLAAFEVLIPRLVQAFDTHSTDMQDLQPVVEVLRKWDYRVGEGSVATTLAVYWGERILPGIYRSGGGDIVDKTKAFVQQTKNEFILDALLETTRDLQAKFGRWDMPWGEVNRFQRISNALENVFDDTKPSFPVAYVSSTWGMLPSYSSRAFPGTKKRYGVNGNSFVCAVEFGEKVVAKSLLAGGESSHETSPYFFDQGEKYAKGEFKEVRFYKEDVLKHAVRTYQPGK